MISFVTWRELHRDVAEFASRFRGRIDLVVGQPRSGTFVANLVALHLNIPCTTVDGLVRGEVWGSGMRIKRELPAKPRVLLVDDSGLSGHAMGKALSLGPFKWPVAHIGVLYASDKIANAWRDDPARSFLRVVPSPRLFAWNWAHAALSRNLALDFDGIICHDPTVREDDEAAYIKAIQTARPLYVPTWPVACIVTHRLERRRAVTEAWIERHGVTVRMPMIMRPEATCVERRAKRDQDGTWKGQVYKKHGWSLFVESDPKQSARIHAVSRKPVYCPASDQFWST